MVTMTVTDQYEQKAFLNRGNDGIDRNAFVSSFIEKYQFDDGVAYVDAYFALYDGGKKATISVGYSDRDAEEKERAMYGLRAIRDNLSATIEQLENNY